MRSKYFAALLARTADADAPIQLRDFTHRVFQQLLTWMYTGAHLSAPVQQPRAPALAPRVRRPAAGVPERQALC